MLPGTTFLDCPWGLVSAVSLTGASSIRAVSFSVSFTTVSPDPRTLLGA